MPAFLSNPSPNSYCNIGKISICFYTKYCYGQPNQSIPSTYISTYDIPNNSGQLTETIKSTALAYYNPASTASPLNKTTLDNLTKQFATDYMNFRTYYFDYVLAGIAAVIPNALTDVIEFDYLSEKDACVTRFYSYPYSWSVQNLGHYDYMNDCVNSIDTSLLNWDAQPYRAVFGPPGSCQGSSLQLTRWGLIFADGRLQQKYLSTDTL